MGEEEGPYPPCRGDHQCHNKCMNLPKTKTDDNDRAHIKMMAIPCLDILSMLLSGQVPHRSNS